jgi:hypothetical protein
MDFLKRLALLIGFTFAWCIAALVLPWVFAVIGAVILGAAVLNMVRAKQAHDAGIFFSSVAGVTLAISGGGFVLSRQAAAMLEPMAEEIAAAAEEPEAREVEKKAAEADRAEHGDAAEPAADSEAEAAPDHAAAVHEAIADAEALAKDKARCANLDEVAAAWGKLGAAQKTDKDYKKARATAKKLETCRKKAVAKIKPKERKTVLAEKGMAKPLKLP